jgi:PAS domain S-box-containing protein
MMRELGGPNQPSTPSSDPVEVLLVDDDEQWAQFLAEQIEKGSERITVSVLQSANETLTALDSESMFDCIVADYRMPEVDGLQLLDRVRAGHPELPFILVSGAGSEDIASEAIDRGVSDYLIKNPRSDQIGEFVNRITTAVDQYRLREAIRESEERYRQVVQQSRDAIVIFESPDELLFWNDRLMELAGRSEARLRELGFVSELVHPDDRRGLREALTDWIDHRPGGTLHHARIVTPDGELRDCEFTGGGITHEEREAALVSIRDVTERRQRERELEWERELNRTIQRVLIESRARQELEESVAAHLLKHGYSLVWFGRPSRDGMVERVVEGRASYLDAIEEATPGDAADREPSAWAAESSQPQFIDDFAELFETTWRDAALEHGLRAGAALPLTYEDISYGLLALYDDETDRFDQTERKLLTELADTVSYAIHNIETERAMSAGSTIEVELEVAGPSYYLQDIAGTPAFLTEEGELTVQGTLASGDDQTLQYVSVAGIGLEEFVELAQKQSAVTDVTVLEDEEPAERVQIVLEGPTPERHLTAHGAIVHGTTVRPDGAVLRIELPATADLRNVIDSLNERFESVSIITRTEMERPSGPAARPTAIELDDLTDRQAMAIEAAFHHGYFEEPRRHSATDVAASLDIAHSTFLQHLRAAQRKIFGNLYG